MNTKLPDSRKGGCLFKLVKLFLLAAVVLLIAVYFSLGFIADYAVKTVMSGTGVEAGIGSVSFSFSDQRFEMTKFYVTNPKGYSQDKKAFYMGEVVVDAGVNPVTFLTQKLITVDEIKIKGMQLSVEMKTASGVSAFLSAPSSNLTDISNALQAKFGGSGQAAQTSTPSATPAKQESEPMRFIVKKIVFESNDVSGGINGKTITVPMPSFTIENLGVAEGGLTLPQLITSVLTTLGKQATYDTAKALVQQGAAITNDVANQAAGVAGDAASTATKAADDAAKSVGNAIKSLF